MAARPCPLVLLAEPTVLMASLCGVYLIAAVLVGHHLNLSLRHSGDGYV